MASQKARSASGQAKPGNAAARNSSGGSSSAARRGSGAAARNASGNSGGSGRGTGRTTQATPARSGKNARGGTGQGGSGQNGGRGPGNRGQGNSGPGGRGPGGPQRRAASGPVEAAVAVDDVANERFAVPAWLQWTSLARSLAGLGVSIFLTIAHYTSTSILDCSANGLVDCAKVTTSSESMVFGVFPVAVLGLAFYVFMVAVNSPWGWRLRIPLVWWARIGSIVVGIGFVLYLVYAEVIQIGNICLWCTSVHVITFLLFGLLVFGASIGTATAATRAAR
jgi:uncharacterized membrane protein